MENNLNLLYKQLQEIKSQKKAIVAQQQFDEAAALRDTEKNIEQKINNIIMKKEFMLSKSKYVRGTNCLKNLWMYVHKTVVVETSEAQEAIFQMGHNVGELAQSYFPNGVLAVQKNEYPNAATAGYTKALIEKGASTIYEATFMYDNIVVAVDVLHKIGNTWYFFEVKASTAVKDYHYTDVAIQYYVMQNSLMQWHFQKGNTLEANVMFLNNQYVRQGELDVKQLFTYENVTAAIQEMQADIAPNTRDMRIMLNAEMPMVAMGKQCTHPFTCEFYDHCYAIENEAIEEEIVEVDDKVNINTKAITEFVKGITYPLGFLDFETIMPAIPEYDESRPYQQLVFQYSLHVIQKHDSAVTHAECLADETEDPRLTIIKKMIVDTKNLQTILVYNIGFERTRINEMIRDFPKYEMSLIALREKLVDLMPIFRYHYRTGNMGKRYSIKVVLPALFPTMNYDDLEIGNGGDASNTFYNLYKSNFDEATITAKRNALIEYCTMDTLAMVKLWEKIRELK
jgi:Domain of unknown function(DUF2779)